MQDNLEALEQLVKFIYDNIQYAEFNTNQITAMFVVMMGRLNQ